MVFIDDQFVKEHLNYEELIPSLEKAYRENIISVAPKGQHPFPSQASNDNIFMLMPAWDGRDYVGVKILSINPINSTIGRPTINGLYLLFDAQHGEHLCTIGAKELTSIRTSAASALASMKLSRKESNSLLVLGNGALAPYMIMAHQYVRPLSRIYLWGRNIDKSELLLKSLDVDIQSKVEVVEDYRKISKDVDIICTATSSQVPLLKLTDISPGQHLDLVGSFTKEMHEVDTDVIKASKVYMDDINVAPKKAGELVKAINDGAIDKSDLLGGLHDLCLEDFCRKTENEISLFKSTGMATQDLVSAILLYKYFRSLNKS